MNSWCLSFCLSTCRSIWLSQNNIPADIGDDGISDDDYDVDMMIMIMMTMMAVVITMMILVVVIIRLTTKKNDNNNNNIDDKDNEQTDYAPDEKHFEEPFINKKAYFTNC